MTAALFLGKKNDEMTLHTRWTDILNHPSS
jgi:hypothetical protein